jgi:stress-induced morphogen
MTSSTLNPSPSSSIPTTSGIPTSLRNRLLLKERTLRRYSTSESSIQGTIGSGTAGIPEAAREQKLLEAPEHLNEKERQIWELLMKELQCTNLEVQDISGGCGSMYGIDIVSEKFRGISMLKQQRLVNDVLGEEIKTWHGVQLKTRAP